MCAFSSSQVDNHHTIKEINAFPEQHGRIHQQSVSLIQGGTHRNVHEEFTAVLAK